jgi:hypothetical protein
MSTPDTSGSTAAPATGASAPLTSSPSASSASSAGTTSAPSSQDSAASAPTAPVAAQPGQAPQTGEPPRERWDEILKNARNKTRAEVEAEYRAKYGKYDAFEQDPLTAVRTWVEQAQHHSLYGPAIQQWLQSMQQARQPTPSIGEEPQADVPIVDAHGQITGYAFSEKQLKAWHTWNRAQEQREIEKRLSPLEQFAQQQQQEREYARVMHQASQQASMTLAQLREQPYFKEHEADIRQALEAHEEWGDNVHAAYNHVLVTKILPTLSQAEQQRVVDSINQKAGATTVSPRGTTAGTPQFKSFASAARYYEEHPEEAAAMANRRK